MPEPDASNSNDVRLAETTSGALREMLAIALPAVVTMTSYSVMQFVDKFVVAKLGTDELSAVGNGGVAAFVPASIFFGILSLISTFASQNLGAGKPERGSAYMWNGLWLLLFAWLVVLLPTAVFMTEFFAVMRGVFGLSVSERVAELEVAYGRILLVGMIFTVAARGLSNFFYGIHKPTVVMVATVTGNIINFGFTIALVFGVPTLGIEPMGVVGAAIATVIGSTIETAIPFLFFISKRTDAKYKTRGSWRFSWPHMKELLKLGWPAGAMWGNEIVCWWVFLAGFVPTFDKDGESINNAAGLITMQYMHISFMPAIGFSIAVSAVVGKCLGAGRPDLAAKRTILGLKITTVYMGVCALVFVLFRGPLVSIFTDADDPATQAALIALGSKLLIVAAIFQLFDAIAIVLSGALRGAGDTIWPGIATIVLSWGCIVGGGWLFVTYWPELGSMGPWIAAAAYIITLALALVFRYRGGKWREMSVVNRDTPADPIIPTAGPALESESHIV